MKKLLIVILLSIPAFAQFPSELPCQAGSQDVSAPTFDPSTQKTRSWVCADALGNVTSPVFASGGSAVSSVFGRVGAVIATSGDYSFSLVSGRLSTTQTPNGGSATAFLNGAGTYTAPTGAVSSAFGRTGAVVGAASDYSNVANLSLGDGVGFVNIGGGATPGSIELVDDGFGRITMNRVGLGGVGIVDELHGNFLGLGTSTAGIDMESGGAGNVFISAPGGGTVTWVDENGNGCGTTLASQTCQDDAGNTVRESSGQGVELIDQQGDTCTLTAGSFACSAPVTVTTCATNGSPAACGDALSGAVAIPTGAVSQTLVVDTTQVTPTSVILLTVDSSLTIGSTTCNSTLATLVGGQAITARVNGTSFTITHNGTITTNPVCISWLITNTQ